MATTADTLPSPDSTAAVGSLFTGKEPVVSAIYARILGELRRIGPFEEQPKKTSIHLARTTGFAGVHPRKSALVLNLRLDRALAGARILKAEQVSRNRYHNEVKLASPDEVDAELTTWLREAYQLSGA
jgi:hypothetical protein